MRPRAVLAPCCETFCASNDAGIKGVQIGPGTTALTLIFFFARFVANERVKLVKAPLVEE